MSKFSPPDPPPLKLDNCITVFVAFTAINGLLYAWAAHKQNDPFSLKKLGASPPSPQPKSAPEGLAISKPTTTAPESSPLSLSPSPSADLSRSRLSQQLPKPESTEEETSKASALDIALSKPKPAAPTPTSVVEFSDVPDNSWASRSIKFLNQRQIIAGLPDGSFRPNKFATRGEFATLLQKIFNQENGQSAINFKDLPADYWAEDAIKEVAQTGLLKGYPAQDFRPDQPVTRAEVLVALATALKLKTPSVPVKTLQAFQDSDQVLNYARAKVAAAKEAGLVAGYPKDKILVPNKPATRAEMATMVYQALAMSKNGEKLANR
ncbi:S-layer homology domain-containing protein [Allocoleopsis franciscana]|uniref:Putative S-layer protein n=1 Tax=Allocoleopsis franciscana PCC 7113 TaxID=1173027 RepID=K9WKF1_9CYAN|nr:S-layer homology domain-containing protein [Allocoleopsis franciscana]AFZ20653.1 putative S-layer protein [Allocoleopsis franciscana PCC 7113]